MNNDLFLEFQGEITDKFQWIKNNNISETNTKAVFIEPYLDFLGYDSKNIKRFIREFKIQGKSVDYALFEDDYIKGSIPNVIIEAKKIDTNIDAEVVINQLKDYYDALKGCKYGILTNGRQYNIYTYLNSPGVMNKKPIVKFMIDDTHINTHIALSYPALYEPNANFSNILESKEREEALLLLRNKSNGLQFIDFLLKQSTL